MRTINTKVLELQPVCSPDGKDIIGCYWFVDDPEIGFYNSEMYDSHREAMRAIITNSVKWDEAHPANGRRELPPPTNQKGQDGN